jgi:glutathione S-transferase
VPTLYGAEWCPFTAAVRELLTEVGIAYVAHPVEPWPEQRDELRRLAGTDEIPVLETDDGEILRGTRAIFDWLERQPPSPYAEEHRRRFHEHRRERAEDAAGRLVERVSVGVR